MITLIVPFFNESSHLRRCIESIRRQTFADYEVLLIDDLSTDDSYTLVAELTQGDARFRLLRNEHKGLFHARNKALSEARGEYLCFLDSDDELLPDYLTALYVDSQQAEVDLVIHGFTHVVNGHRKEARVLAPGIYDIDSESQRFFSSFDIVEMGNVFGKLYCLSLVREYQLRFSPHVLLSEDMFFVVSYLCHCHRICLSQKSNYLYIAHGHSMSTFYWDFDTEKRSYTELKRVWEQLLGLRPCAALEATYGQFTGNYVNRLVYTSLVHPQSRNHPESCLQQLETDYLPLYGTAYHPTTLFTKSLKWSAIRRHYRLYRLLMRIAIIRYGITVNYA